MHARSVPLPEEERDGEGKGQAYAYSQWLHFRSGRLAGCGRAPIFAVARAGGIAVKVADGPVARTSTAASWSIPQPEVVALLTSFLPPDAAAGSGS